MTTLQVQKLRMYMALRILLGANLAILEKLPNAIELLTALDKAIADIQANIVLQQKSGNDLKEQHDKLHTNLVTDVMDASRKMQAYAANTKNNALLKDTKFSDSEVSHMKDVDLVKTAKLMYSIVNEHLSELALYGLTTDTQATLQNDTTLYEVSNPQKENEQLGQMNVTSTLADNYKTADDIVANFDKLVEIVRYTEPKFYADYKFMRKVDVATDVVQLVAKITDAETGAGIPNVTVALNLTDSNLAPIVKLSADKGGFQIKTLPNGNYTINVVKLGYQTQTLSIIITGDAPYSLNVKMVRG
jgi:hypothetical protein